MSVFLDFLPESPVHTGPCSFNSNRPAIKENSMIENIPIEPYPGMNEPDDFRVCGFYEICESSSRYRKLTCSPAMIATSTPRGYPLIFVISRLLITVVIDFFPCHINWASRKNIHQDNLRKPIFYCYQY